MIPKKRILLIIESSTSYGRSLVRGIAKYVHERKEWWIDIENRGIHEPSPPVLKNWHGDGIICRVNSDAMLKAITQTGCPFVDILFSNKYSFLVVQTDDRKIAELALEHFLESGLKNFAYYSFGNSYWSCSRARFFDVIVREAGYRCHICPTKKRERLTVDPLWKAEYEPLLHDWLQTLPRPIGILAANDTHAMRLLASCRNLDIAVPEEIAILGINNDGHLCETLTPTLSSIDPNAEQIGYEVARLLDLKMQGKALPKKTLFVRPVRVVRRQSTDMSAIENEEVAEAVRFIREYATQGIGVREVVEALQTTPRALQRGFKECLGRTPEKEIIRIRMNHAIDLLRDSRLTNHEIAQLSGFKTLRYFLQVFRKERGETPSQYRKREGLTSYLGKEQGD